MKTDPALALCALLLLLSGLCAQAQGSAERGRTRREMAPAASEATPFHLGAFVGANVFAWGDLAEGPDGVADLPGIVGDLKRHGLNAVWVTGFDAGFFADTPLMATWLDAAAEHGMKVVLEGAGGPLAIDKRQWVPDGDPGIAKEVLARALHEVAPAWQSIAREYGTHPALLAYCPVEEIGDDPESGERHTVQALDEVGRAIARVDPRHPVVTIHIASWYAVAAEEVRLRGGQPGFGALVYDHYVFSHRIPEWSDVVDSNLDYPTVEDATRAYLDALDRYVALGANAGVPTWVFAQTYESVWTRKLEGRPERRPLARAPSAAEVRYQVWAAVLAGARGVFFFTYHSTPPPTEETRATLDEWEEGTGLRTLDGRPTAMYAALTAVALRLEPHYALLGRLEPEGDREELGARLHARAFRDPEDGGRYLVVVNEDVTEGRKLAMGTRTPAGRLGVDLFLEPGDGALLAVEGGAPARRVE